MSAAQGLSAGVPPEEGTLRAKALRARGMPMALGHSGAPKHTRWASLYVFIFFPSFVLITYGMSGGNGNLYYSYACVQHFPCIRPRSENFLTKSLNAFTFLIT